MTLKKKLLSGMFALLVGVAVASPGRALADEWRQGGNHEWREHHDGDRDDASRWHRDHDRYAWRHHDRDWNRPLPRNGEGMINRNSPNLYWACSSEGHHCHWAPRF